MGPQLVKASVGTQEINFTAEACTAGSPCEPLPAHPSMLAFVSERDGNSEIYVMNVDGTGLLRLTEDAGYDLDPAWSPDGKRIAFTSNRAGNSDIYVMDADGSNVVRRSQPGLSNAPAWSPDSSKIAFVSDWRAYDFVYDVYVMNADGSNIRPLIEGPFAWPDNRFYFQPSWSPDGQKIAVVVCVYAWENCYPSSSIAITNADGTGLTTLVEAGGYARPTWSPDGSTIAFGSRTCSGCVSSLRYTRVDGSASGLISSNGHSPAWRPHGAMSVVAQ